MPAVEHHRFTAGTSLHLLHCAGAQLAESSVRSARCGCAHDHRRTGGTE